MVKYKEEALDEVFQALSSSSRRQILSLVASSPRNLSELAGPLGMSLPAVHKHIVVLERAGLIEGQKSGREREISFRPQGLGEAQAWIAYHRDFWNKQLDSLGNYVAELKGKEESHGTSDPDRD